MINKQVTEWHEPPFPRTVCACHDCVQCCKKQPGPLAPGDFERIAEFLGETPNDVKRHFWASPGARILLQGKVIRVGTITPQRVNERCVFLDKDDRCKIHPVAPVGCAYFDTHMGLESHDRALWLVAGQMSSLNYQEFRKTLVPATSHNPTPTKFVP